MPTPPSIASTNPFTGETFATFEPLSEQALQHKLALAQRAFELQRKSPLAERTRRMAEAARLLERDKRKLAELAVKEMGKTISAAIAEVEKCAFVCRHYAENGAQMLADQPMPSSASKSFVRWLPLGPVLAIMPWNFPYWQVFRFAAPALVAGNVGLLKHASNVPQCALAIEEVFRQAGFADGCFQTLLLDTHDVEKVIADSRVVAVTLTGSEAAGISVAQAAGKQLKKVVLELGGSDPFIVMPSADLDAAIRTAVTARHINNGQSCIAAKRFIIHEAVYEAFEKGFVAKTQALVMGDPMQPNTQLGPVVSARARDELHAQVQRAQSQGAKVLLGGKPLERAGYFYEATIIAHIPKDAAIRQEEFFGPVAQLYKVSNIDEAIAVANETPFGLGSSVWTQDAQEIERFSNDIDAGQTFVNAMVASDPRLPFGGVKRSGYGRELATLGMQEFMNAKTIFIA